VETRGKRKDVSLVMIAANNHYAGFGPGTANLFRKMVGLSELSWENQQEIQERVQQMHKLEHQQEDQSEIFHAKLQKDYKAVL
jgi:hypothetical protein